MPKVPLRRTRVALKHPDILPPLLPVPELDCHVIAGGEDEGLCGVDDDGADVVGMRLEGRNLLAGVVVVYPDLAEKSMSARAFPVGSTSARITHKSSDPHTIQFFLAMNRPARTGTSVSSKVLTTCWVS